MKSTEDLTYCDQENNAGIKLFKHKSEVNLCAKVESGKGRCTIRRVHLQQVWANYCIFRIIRRYFLPRSKPRNFGEAFL